MKRNLLFGSLALMGVALLTGCNKNDGFTQTVPFSASTLNVITNVGTGATTVSSGMYYFSLTMTNTSETGVINVANLAIDKDAPLSFTTEEQSYLTDYYYALFENVRSSTVNLNNATILLTPYYYRPSQYLQGKIDFPNYGDVVVAYYNIGQNYLIRTFQPETFYVGTTNTSYPYMGQQQTYSTDDIYYQLSLDIKTNSATIYMYNAKFSDSPEPRKEMIVIKGLTPSYSADGITVTGQNITPLVGEGGATTPNEDFIFKEIKFQTINNILTQCSIDFTVETHMNMGGNTVTLNYLGNFTGDYLYNSNGR